MTTNDRLTNLEEGDKYYSWSMGLDGPIEDKGPWEENCSIDMEAYVLGCTFKTPEERDEHMEKYAHSWQYLWDNRMGV